MSEFFTKSLIYGSFIIAAGSFGFLVGTLLQSVKVSALYRRLELADAASCNQLRIITDLSAALELAGKAGSEGLQNSKNNDPPPTVPPKVHTKERQPISSRSD